MAAAAPANPSLWVATTPDTDYPRLEGDISVDVAVVGGGITGITAAHLLKREGKTVALVEANRIAHGVTGYTTAKLTVGQGLVYGKLLQAFGTDGARTFAESNQAAIARIEALVEELGIDCDLERASNYVYTESPSEVQAIRDEVEAAKRSGIDAHLTTETDLPFPVQAAIRVDGQAQFHPRKYLLPIAAGLAGDGSHVFELTRALKVKGNGEVRTDTGTVHAKHVILATHLPFADRGLFFAKAHPAMSYGISAEVDEGAAPLGMYISSDSPTRSIRSTPGDAGRRMLIVGGEGHKPGAERDTERRYDALEEFLAERFVAGPVEHRWSAHDYLSLDGAPYIGRLTRRDDNVYVATGFAKWGLTKGTLAAMLLTDLVVGRANPWAELYDAKRLHPLASAKSFVKENGEIGVRFVGERLRRRAGQEDLERLEPGEGAIARVRGRQIAGYRDDAGRLHTLSPTCTHLGCVVGWNTAERTWDCPCHGSRFSGPGEVLEGPATEPLKRTG